MTTGVFGGAFDPPHNGHLAVLSGAERHFTFARTLVLVVADPGHRTVRSPGDVRLALARLAFPEHDVELDEHARTVDLLRARQFDDPVFLISADELADFPSWKEPAAVLELARLGVATRPGHPREALEAVRAPLSQPGRVVFFEIDPVPVSSTDVRARLARGEAVDDLVPPAVDDEIERLGLYR